MKKKLIENSLIYSGLQVLQRGIGFLLLPVYTRFLTPDDYGIVSVVSSVVAFLGVLYLLGLNSAALKYYFDFKDNAGELKRFWGTIVTFLLFLSLVVTCILLAFGRPILYPLLAGINYYPYMFFGIIGAAFVPFFTIYQSLLQAQHNGRKYAILNVTNFLVLLFLTLIFVVIFKLKAMGPILATTCTAALFFVVTLWNMRGSFVLGIIPKHLKKSLIYSLPVIPHTLIGWASSLLDRLLINKFISTAATGIYSIGYLFGGIPVFVSSAINQAYVPWFFEEMKQNETGKIKKFFVMAMVLNITLVLWVTVFAKEALWIMSKGDFREAWRVVGLLSFGNFFISYYFFLVNQLFFSEKGTRYVPIATVSAALISFILNVILIQKYGMMGAAVTMLLTNIFTTVCVGWFAQRVQPVDWDHELIFKLLLINGSLCVCSYFISASSVIHFVPALGIKFLLVAICTFINYRLCMNRVGDIHMLHKLFALIKGKVLLAGQVDLKS